MKVKDKVTVKSGRHVGATGVITFIGSEVNDPPYEVHFDDSTVNHLGYEWYSQDELQPVLTVDET